MAGSKRQTNRRHTAPDCGVTRHVESKTLIGMHGYCVPTPHGDVYIVAPADSDLVHRVAGLCENGALQEFVRAFQGETRKRLSDGRGNCHSLAFEFAYAATASLGLAGVSINEQSVGKWSWCVGHAPVIDSEHSWIEFYDESIDVVLTNTFSPSRDYQTVVLVQPRSELRAHYQVTNVESCSFVDFSQWLISPRRYRLFSRHGVLSDTLSKQKLGLMHKIVVYR